MARESEDGLLIGATSGLSDGESENGSDVNGEEVGLVAVLVCISVAVTTFWVAMALLCCRTGCRRRAVSVGETEKATPTAV